MPPVRRRNPEREIAPIGEVFVKRRRNGALSGTQDAGIEKDGERSH